MTSWRCYGAAQIGIWDETYPPFRVSGAGAESIRFRVVHYSNNETWRGQWLWNPDKRRKLKFGLYIQSLMIESARKQLAFTYTDTVLGESDADLAIYRSLELVALAFPQGPLSVSERKQSRDIVVSREDPNGHEKPQTLRIDCWKDKMDVIHFAYKDYSRGKWNKEAGTWQAFRPEPFPDSFPVQGWLEISTSLPMKEPRILPKHQTLGQERRGK